MGRANVAHLRSATSLSKITTCQDAIAASSNYAQSLRHRRPDSARSASAAGDEVAQLVERAAAKRGLFCPRRHGSRLGLIHIAPDFTLMELLGGPASHGFEREALSVLAGGDVPVFQKRGNRPGSRANRRI